MTTTVAAATGGSRRRRRGYSAADYGELVGTPMEDAPWSKPWTGLKIVRTGAPGDHNNERGSAKRPIDLDDDNSGLNGAAGSANRPIEVQDDAERQQARVRAKRRPPPSGLVETIDLDRTDTEVEHLAKASREALEAIESVWNGDDARRASGMEVLRMMSDAITNEELLECTRFPAGVVDYIGRPDSRLYMRTGSPLWRILSSSRGLRNSGLPVHDVAGVRETMDLELYAQGSGVYNNTLRLGFFSDSSKARIVGMIGNIAQDGVVRPRSLFFRGVSHVGKVQIGDIVRDPGFMSKTTSIQDTKFFFLQGRTTPTVFVLHYPNDSVQLMFNAEEKEVVSFPGETFVLTDIGVMTMASPQTRHDVHGNITVKHGDLLGVKMCMLTFVENLYVDRSMPFIATANARMDYARAIAANIKVNPDIDAFDRDVVKPLCEDFGRVDHDPDVDKQDTILTLGDTVELTCFYGRPVGYLSFAALLQTHLQPSVAVNLRHFVRDDTRLNGVYNLEYEFQAGRVERMVVLRNFDCVLAAYYKAFVRTTPKYLTTEAAEVIRETKLNGKHTTETLLVARSKVELAYIKEEQAVLKRGGTLAAIVKYTATESGGRLVERVVTINVATRAQFFSDLMNLRIVGPIVDPETRAEAHVSLIFTRGDYCRPPRPLSNAVKTIALAARPDVDYANTANIQKNFERLTVFAEKAAASEQEGPSNASGGSSMATEGNPKGFFSAVTSPKKAPPTTTLNTADKKQTGPAPINLVPVPAPINLVPVPAPINPAPIDMSLPPGAWPTLNKVAVPPNASVAGIYIVVKRKYLLVQKRGTYDGMDGLICSPGGAIDGPDGETAKDAAIRELAEEAGLVLPPSAPVYPFYVSKESKKKGVFVGFVLMLDDFPALDGPSPRHAWEMELDYDFNFYFSDFVLPVSSKKTGHAFVLINELYGFSDANPWFNACVTLLWDAAAIANEPWVGIPPSDDELML